MGGHTRGVIHGESYTGGHTRGVIHGGSYTGRNAWKCLHGKTRLRNEVTGRTA